MSRGPRQSADLGALSDLAPELAQMLVSVAYDIALGLDEGGVIKSVALGETETVSASACEWVGQRWTDTVTGSTREKAEAVLDDLANTGISRLRHVAHVSGGSDIPIAYAAVRLGDQGPTLAVGRDMRAVAAMQERLLQSQREIERDHWRHRQAETRYRLLFQVSTEPALILDAASLRILDANTAAAERLGRTIDELVGSAAADGLDPDARMSLTTTLETARQSGRIAEGALQLGDGRGETGFSVTPFHNEAAPVLLVMFRDAPTARRADDASHEGPEPVDVDTLFADFVRRTPDAVVICGGAGRIASANQAFLDLVQWPAHRPFVGGDLSEWIAADPSGQNDGSVETILGRARRDGSIGLQAGSMRRPRAGRIDVEFSAATVGRGDLVGFIIRVSHHPTMQRHGDDDGSDRNVH